MNIRISYSEIEAAATQLGSGREEICARLEHLRTQMQNLIASGFSTSVASGKFLAAFESYSMSAKNVADQLLEIQNFLRTASQTMQDVDAQIAARIG